MPETERSDGRRPQRRRRFFGLLLVGMVAYALGAATTTAFTQAANVLTAIPIVVVAVMVVVRWPLRPRPHPRPGQGENGAHPFRAWVVLFAAVVAWELAEYASRGSRAAHPTLSSMLDAVDRYYLLKAAMFFGWLYLGAAIVRKGRTAPAAAAATATVPPVDPPGRP